ncbi:MAG: hypothetical protein HQK79_13665 [Desulfobacterales bacterium]|nr:hypothetical protein [Desulfobacterales bacterium]MBF0397483.1 hypothetical protein [Desulfobacterales bacterium]
MLKAFLFFNTILSFVIGAIIFLTGIGAIAGCAGGLVLLILGGVIAFGAISEFIKFNPPSSDDKKLSDVIDLIKRNGSWSTSY